MLKSKDKHYQAVDQENVMLASPIPQTGIRSQPTRELGRACMYEIHNPNTDA